MTPGVQPRRSGWGYQLPLGVTLGTYLLCLLIQVTSAKLSYTPMTRDRFHFTQPVYNVTIPEGATGKTYAIPQTKMGIWVSDPDVKIRYKITAGDPENLFKAESKLIGDFSFLNIKMRTGSDTMLNREVKSEYTLQIKAKTKTKDERRFDAIATVRIKVEDKNELQPFFYPRTYNVNVDEDTPLHQSLLAVSASDADEGMNGEVYYSFVQSTEMFAVHPSTGVITLTQPLNLEEQETYELDVTAKDRGIGTKTGADTAKVTIKVIKVNLHAPEIKPLPHSSVYEHGSVGTVYAILSISDPDKGRNGQVDTVKIIDGDTDGYFTIHQRRKTGEFTIEVAQSLDRELMPGGYNLTVIARDRGVPPKTSAVSIPIEILDLNDQSPQFRDSYKISVEEIVPPNTPLVFVSAFDRDIGLNARLRYSITKGNDLGWFKMNTTSGLISTAEWLDAETTQNIVLTVLAADSGNRGTRRKGKTLVTVKIVDSNDNSPEFKTSVVEDIEIDENQPVGTFVTKVEAVDLDSGENGYVSYSIANVQQVPFKINHFSGEITTTESLDYETMKRTYKLRVRASDWGLPYRRETETVLTVKLRPLNDNKPVFEEVECAGYLSRETPLRSDIVTVSALDLDIGNIITYQLVKGNEDQCFDLSASTGKLILTCDLSSVSWERRVLVIRSFDQTNYSDNMTITLDLVNSNSNGRLVNDQKVHCKATGITQLMSEAVKTSEDVNNNEDVVDKMEEMVQRQFENRYAPTFDLVSGIKTIDEGQPVGFSAFGVHASDDDSGYNGEVVYVIASGNEDGAFKVDTKTGKIVVMSDVDRERQYQYKLNITAYDLGQPRHSASVVVTVYVNDVNDYAPSFKHAPYFATVSESEKAGTTVLQVSTEDMDSGSNAEVSYFLQSNTDLFHINNVTGVITTKMQLDREVRPQYILDIMAKDHGKQKQLSSFTTVTVNVGDINDEPPKFEPDVYRMRVREDLPVGSTILTITARDPDLGQGGIVRYNLIGGSDDKFAIDRLTGTIRIANSLDYERKQLYNITARARDRGDNSLTSTCTVLIEVIDVNENLYPPKFKDFFMVTVGKVKENEAVGTKVIQVIAHDDDDSPEDSAIIYSIREGSGLGRFTIEQDGWIRTNEVLDRESQARYWLTVYAQDRGAVPLHSVAWVLVEVEDKNDNSPQTPEPIYYASVKENSPSGVSVIQIEAEDEDEDSGLTYEIKTGNPQAFFNIDRKTGLITTTNRKLDREAQDQHILEVLISDNGSPQLMSITRIVVNVEDENDEKPVFKGQDRAIRIQILETDRTDVPLFRMVAFDNDVGANAQIDYFIMNGKENLKFNINPQTGELYLKARSLDVGTYDIQIKANDGGNPQQSSTVWVKVSVVSRPTESPTAPRFSSEGFKFYISESKPVGSQVGLVEAQDGDGDKIWFYITGGDPEDQFFIDVESGEIGIANPLDRELRSSYNLTVTVTDGVHTVASWAHITVMDVNDNTPQFTESHYAAVVSESALVGTSVITVTATDKDENKQLFFSIHSAADKSSTRLFEIGDHSGVISTKERLDRESIAQHKLTIMVREEGATSTMSHRNLTRVVIDVLDHNDHPPEFLSGSFNGRVFETAAIGTSVVQVMATDKDKGENAEIHYTIVTGNIGNTFSIDEKLGIITVSKQLDRDLQSKYTLSVMATDNGIPSHSTQTNVNIDVTISNNAPPKFEQDEYTAEIRENSPVGTYIATVAASSRSSVVYEILGANDSLYFQISPNSGVLRTRIVFDYDQEEFRSFNVTVRATNMVGAYTQTSVFVHVLDVNDNAPEFLQEQYVGEISESAEANSVVLTNESLPLVIKALDRDSSSLNAFKIYYIDTPKAEKYFNINPNTGAIRTNMKLDHEDITEFDFLVQVKDMGTPQLSAEVAAKVKVKVIDVNDSPPVFNLGSYQATVLLPTHQDVAVVTVGAFDPDTGISSQLKYSITGGDEEKKFSIEPLTGMVRVRDENNLSSRYDLLVNVTDGKFSTRTTVTVNIKQTEDSGLRFTQKQYNASAMENKTTVDQVTMVQVVGYQLNEQLTFSILNPTDMFTIGRTSGVLRTTGKPFDREKQDLHKVVVEVQDSHPRPRVAHVVVHVNILDMNDNAPMFVNEPYHAVVSIDALPGTTVKKVEAVDQDIGRNSKVQYSIISGDDGKFHINSATGELSLQQPLQESDQNHEFMVLVEAEDQGEDVQLRSRVVVPIRVISQATPVFDDTFYSVSVRENTPVNSVIFTLEAKSPNNQKLIYSITKGNIYDEFAVNFSIAADTIGPCAIILIDNLDAELRQGYELTVRATDTLSGAYAEALVAVTVVDVNDKAPSFDSLVYVVSVSEAVSIGRSILAVSAYDADKTAPHNLLKYHLEAASEDTSDHVTAFDIDPSRGEITTKTYLDHETNPKMHFVVVAVDSGYPALSSTAHVYVTVTDLNDNPPVFDPQSFSATISDQAKRGQFVTMVTAIDGDSSDAGQLMYAIVSGDKKGAFTIDSSNGMIYLSSLRQPELQSLYMLNISVTDGVFTNFARVSIDVRNSNNHPPVFQESLYVVELAENVPIGHVVTTVTAEDLDSGYYGALTYHLKSEKLKELFDLHPKTGEISTLELLDREFEQVYNLPIVAVDNGGRVGFTTVRIMVLDADDNKPSFFAQEYKANVFADAAEESSVIKVEASDADITGEVQYSIVDGSSASSLFKVHRKTGVVKVKKSLRDSVNQVFQFFMRAKSVGGSNTVSEVPIEILVMGPSDTPPQLESPPGPYFITEDKPVGTVVAMVNAKSEGNQTLVYKIIPGQSPMTNNPEKFQIDEQGRISVKEALDYETTKMFTLHVRVESQTTPPLVATAEVVVQLQDINDNAPHFDSKPYSISIPENANIGSKVIQIKAYDNDTGTNSDLIYSFSKDTQEKVVSVFSLDSHSGWISTLAELDRETVEEYELEVVAVDRGVNVQLNDTTTVRIRVTDINDEPPIFSKDVYQGTVQEDALPGQTIVTVTTSDKDEVGIDVVYYITSGDILGQFNVDRQGQVYVRRALDREEKSEYRLQVTATDGVFVTHCQLDITVLDTNDNTPDCGQPLHQVVKPEDFEVGGFVGRIQATDADQPGTSHAQIEYSLEGTGAYMFEMNEKTGIITTVAPLDRETAAEYQLMVRAVDRGGKSCTTELYVTLIDVNDNPPRFDRTEYTVAIPENAEPNTLLTRVSAIDSDIGLNRKVHYLMLESKIPFRINPDSGVISLNSSLDRETKAFYNVTVYAYDKGTPSLTSSAQLLVSVTDINDNPPVFSRSMYAVSVREDKQLTSVVTTVKATSKDIGENARIAYSIVGGNNQGVFAIDAETGEISVQKLLNYELVKEYVLTVEARDHGQIPLSDQAVVRINVTDYNDNAPIFSEAVFSVSLREDVDVGYSVIQVQADDRDSGENAAITYAITKGDKLAQFKINPKTGEIKVQEALDREMIPKYSLEVTATDQGSPPLSTNVVVIVEVGDANDNPPEFSQSNYTAVVQEDREAGFSTLRFIVSDQDTRINGPPFTFNIIEGNYNNEFRINDNGVLITTATFDRTVQDVYDLIVRVHDNGTPRLFSDTYVTVRIIEEPTYPPQITPLTLSISSYLDEFPGGTIGRIKAVDRDTYDKLTYNLVSDRSLFSISEQNGTITAFSGLDAGMYILNVSVTDGKFVTYGEVKLDVSVITEDMVEHAVAIRFKNMLPEEFITLHKNKFRQILWQGLTPRIQDIYILSVQPAHLTTPEVREKRDVSSDLDVLLAVEKSRSTYYKRRALHRKLTQAKDRMETEMGVQILKIVDDVCKRDDCDKGSCEMMIHFDRSQVQPIITESESYVAAKFQLVPECRCRLGYGGDRCSQVINECSDNPCPAYKECEPDMNGYKCICPRGKTGPKCLMDLPEDINNCLDSTCMEQKPLMFSGDSFAHWILKETIRRRLSLSMSLRTLQASAMLMYATGESDFSVLELSNGYIQYRFDCGSGPGLVRISQQKINDGSWHKITVERHGNHATLTLDDKFTDEANAPGTHIVVNLYGNSVYFGAEVQDSTQTIRQSFLGCMKEVKVKGQILPYKNSNAVATVQKLSNVKFSCDADLPGIGVCRSIPCHNGGTCTPTPGQSSGFRCDCHSRFKGATCEFDKDPCASSPCLHGGTCINLSNDFRCHCKGQITGKRCDYGFYCLPNPCKNGGVCSEGLTGPTCNCGNNFEGPHCEYDIDECKVRNPCKNGGSCHNTYGGFICNCTKGGQGDLCDVIDFPVSVTAGKFGVGFDIEEIAVTAGCVVGILFIVIIFVVVRRHVVRKKRRQERIRQDALDNETDNMILNCNQEEYSRSKLSNIDAAAVVPNIPPSPRPPPVPNRPASYTPSTHDSVNTLNNFDTVRNYGSAAEELESIHMPIVIPEFLQNLNFEKSGASIAPSLPTLSASDSESIQKPAWEFEYPMSNNMETFTGGDPKSSTDSRLTALQQARQQFQDAGPGSMSSLQESEDEMGYHWDASDWAPNPALPNITEVPMKEVPDSPASSSRSNQSGGSNTVIANEASGSNPPMQYSNQYPYDSEFPEYDSEYVGDSEYAENEDDDDDDEFDDNDDNLDFPEPPNFEQILQLQGELNYDDNYQPGQLNYNLHPNQYLPNYNVDGNGDHDRWPEPPREPQNNMAVGDNNVQYGFPNVPRRFPMDYYTDYDQSAASAVDDMSVSMGGYTSTNASMSDISGLCEIEDSEINLSDNDSDDNISSKMSNAHLHTQV